MGLSLSIGIIAGVPWVVKALEGGARHGYPGTLKAFGETKGLLYGKRAVAIRATFHRIASRQVCQQHEGRQNAMDWPDEHQNPGRGFAQDLESQAQVAEKHAKGDELDDAADKPGDAEDG